MIGVADPAGGRFSMPACIARIKNHEERSTAEAILAGLCSVQVALGRDEEDKFACPTRRIGESAAYRIARGASGGRALPWRHDFDSCGVSFHGQAAGVVEAARVGGLASEVADQFSGCLKKLVRVLGDPDVVPLRCRVPPQLIPALSRNDVDVFESVFPPIRIHYLKLPGWPPAVIWIDALSHRDGAREETLSDDAIREFA